MFPHFFLTLITVSVLMSAIPHIATSHAAAIHVDRDHLRVNNELESNLKSMAKSISDKIKHIIILMEENRSFDHVLGYYGKGTNGVTNQCNLVDIDDPSSASICVSNNAPYINQCDPDHSLNPTTEKIYGSLKRAEDCNYTCEKMDGFVQFEHKHGHTAANNYCNVMESFDPSKLPVFTTLAENYVVMDRFFAAIPGPTNPNRQFHLSATSNGLTSTGPWYLNEPGRLFPQKTIFDQVKEVNGTWKLYYNDTPWEMYLESVAHNAEHTAPLSEFFYDCQTGNLPDYAFINPRTGLNISEKAPSNDQHPDHDMRAGEQYYKAIYEAIRASPQWEETLFVLTYDEHGGFHDHVLPPLNIPGPDDYKHDSYPTAGFKFDRLGIRIPTLLISPWVPKGLVVGRAPEAQRPFANSEYDLTSIMASARKILGKLKGVPALTKRDAWSSTFEHVLDILPEARTDCPMHLPDTEPPTMESLMHEAALPINDLQMEHILITANLADGSVTSHPSHLSTQGQVGDFMHNAFHTHRIRTLEWKASKLRHTNHRGLKENPHPIIAETPYAGTDLIIRTSDYKKGVISHSFTLTKSNESNVWTIHVKVPKNQSDGKLFGYNDALPNNRAMLSTEELCLDSNTMTEGDKVFVSKCYPHFEPNLNRDKYQQWIYGADATIRPYDNQQLCLSNNLYANSTSTSVSGTVFIERCNPESLYQHWGYDHDLRSAGGVITVVHLA